MKIEPVAEDDDDDDLSKDLDDALEESYRSVLEETAAGSQHKIVSHGVVSVRLRNIHHRFSSYLYSPVFFLSAVVL